MAQYIDIQTDFNEVKEYLKQMGKSGRTVSRYILRNIGRITKNKVKKSYNLYLHKKSGSLYKSIKSTLSKRKDYDVISANAKSEKGVRYGYVHAAGTTIKAKKNKYLTFKVNDKWVKKVSVRIPSKNFMEEPANSYLNSSQMRTDIDFYLEKKLQQMEKQGRIERVYEDNT